ncbi:MAG TPA: Ig-like domain-containing protein, partial [Dehalococcoidales bacterium]|nr:Ig-like domain-containing protein [Dehalococcoidales bacterium]
LLPGFVGVDYSQLLEKRYGSAVPQWTLNGGGLPPGLALANDGSITGNPTTPGRYSFNVKLTSGAESVTQEFSIQVNALGEIWAWGYNFTGQLGNGESTGVKSTPVQTSTSTGLTSPVTIDAGSGHSLAIDQSGQVWSWGQGGNGQLGQGNSIWQSPLPGKVVTESGAYLKDIVLITAGNLQGGMAIDQSGRLWVWGDNQQGQLGNDTTVFSRNSAGLVPGMTDIVAVASSSGYTSFAVKSDGSVWGWGWNNYGQVGNGDYSTDGSDIHTSIPSRVQGITDAVAVAAGWDFGLALDKYGRVWGWGSNSYGQLGLGYTESVPHLLPSVIHGLNNIIAISCGARYSLALDKNGQVWAWGYSSEGELGQSDKLQQNSPVKVKGAAGSGFLSDIKSISAGFNFAFALDNSGNIWTWGNNTHGQMGNGTNGAGTGTSIPQQMAALSGLTAVSAGSISGLALKLVAAPPPSNSAPVAAEQSVLVKLDTPKTITLAAQDADGDALVYTLVSGPSHGILSAITGNTLTYTPSAGYNGPDSFTFKANDGTADSNAATVNIVIVPDTHKFFLVGPGGVSGTLDIAAGDSVLLITGTAIADVTFPAGTWTIFLKTEMDWKGYCLVEIGSYNPVTGVFTKFNAMLTDPWVNGTLVLTLDQEDSGTVPQGEALGIRVTNNDNTDHEIDTDGSYLLAPQNAPGYPVPELPALALLGLGLAGIAGYLILRRKQSRKQAIN